MTDLSLRAIARETLCIAGAGGSAVAVTNQGFSVVKDVMGADQLVGAEEDPGAASADRQIAAPRTRSRAATRKPGGRREMNAKRTTTEGVEGAAAGRPTALVATDGSEAALHAGERAVGLAGFLGAKLYVLYALDEEEAFHTGSTTGRPSGTLRRWASALQATSQNWPRKPAWSTRRSS
jgi:hypothetical protein